MSAATAPTQETAVLHVGGLHYASERAVVEQVLARRPGVLAVDVDFETLAETGARDDADQER